METEGKISDRRRMVSGLAQAFALAPLSMFPQPGGEGAIIQHHLAAPPGIHCPSNEHQGNLYSLRFGPGTHTIRPDHRKLHDLITKGTDYATVFFLNKRTGKGVLPHSVTQEIHIPAVKKPHTKTILSMPSQSVTSERIAVPKKKGSVTIQPCVSPRALQSVLNRDIAQATQKNSVLEINFDKKGHRRKRIIARQKPVVLPTPVTKPGHETTPVIVPPATEPASSATSMPVVRASATVEPVSPATPISEPNTPVVPPSPTVIEFIPTVAPVPPPSFTPAALPTSTELPVDTPIIAPTSTESPADTSTPDPTATDTKTPNPTATTPPTPDAIATATDEPTSTPTETPTPTEDPSPTATRTAFPTPIPTATPMPSPTRTATSTPSPTRTPTRIASPTFTVTPTSTTIVRPTATTTTLTPTPTVDLNNNPCGWKYVYQPGRLKVLNCNVSAAGTIDKIYEEPDGDVHMNVHLDSAYLDLLNDNNKKYQGGDLVIEVTCKVPNSESVCRGYVNPIVIPPVGAHISFSGSWVTDAYYHPGWNEIHPVESLSTDTNNPGNTVLPTIRYLLTPKEALLLEQGITEKAAWIEWNREMNQEMRGQAAESLDRDPGESDQSDGQKTPFYLNLCDVPVIAFSTAKRCVRTVMNNLYNKAA